MPFLSYYTTLLFINNYNFIGFRDVILSLIVSIGLGSMVVNNRFSRPRVNFIRAEDGRQRRYYNQRRNSYHEYEDRRRSRERDQPRYYPARRSTSLDNTERLTNSERLVDHRTERQGPTLSIPNDASTSTTQHNNVVDPLNGRRQ